MQTLRSYLIQQLGGKCSRCGWAEDERVLQLKNRQEGATEQRRHTTRDKYLMQALETVASGNWYLLCMNCHWVEMYGNREKKALAPPVVVEIAKARPVFVWQTNLPVADAVGTAHAFLNRKVQEGYEVVIVVQEGEVYRYGEPEQAIASGWEVFARQRGLGGLPEESMGVAA